MIHPHKFTHGTGESTIELPVTLPVRRCDPCDFEYPDEVGEELLALPGMMQHLKELVERGPCPVSSNPTTS